MGQASGIIAEILSRIDKCEFCDRAADSGDSLEIYTIDKFDADNLCDLSDNIIVLCPECKRKYDDGTFSKKHLKVCVRLRDPGLKVWLRDLFERYGIAKRSNGKNDRTNKVIHKLVNNPNFIDNVMFIFGIFIVVLGVLMFAYGYQNVSAIDNALVGTTNGPGQLTGENMYYLFMELAGVVLALIGLFIELRVAGNTSSASK